MPNGPKFVAERRKPSGLSASFRAKPGGLRRMVLGLNRRAADVSPLVSATVKQGRRAHAHRSPESKPSAIGRAPFRDRHRLTYADVHRPRCSNSRR